MHSVLSHFPTDRNCEVCWRTKMTRVPCRLGQTSGDLITADHKVLNAGGDSRNNHRHSVMAQGLATQWIQSYPCRTETSQETERSPRKFLEPSEKPRVTYSDKSMEFGKSCDDLSWGNRTWTPHRSETNGIATRSLRRTNEGTSAVLLQSGLY